jgi:hypothetical protein
MNSRLPETSPAARLTHGGDSSGLGDATRVAEVRLADRGTTSFDDFLQPVFRGSAFARRDGNGRDGHSNAPDTDLCERDIAPTAMTSFVAKSFSMSSSR